MDEQKLRGFIRKHLKETKLNEVTPADFQAGFNAATTVDAETIKQSLMALSMFVSVPAIKIAADKLLSSWSEIKKNLPKEKPGVDNTNKQENDMKLSESRLRQIIREEIVAKKKLNEMGPEVAAAFSNVASAMSGVDVAMVTPAILVAALSAAGVAVDSPQVKKIMAKMASLANRNALPDNH
jgi:hypothetical protein